LPVCMLTADMGMRVTDPADTAAAPPPPLGATVAEAETEAAPDAAEAPVESVAVAVADAGGTSDMPSTLTALPPDAWVEAAPDESVVVEVSVELPESVDVVVEFALSPPVLLVPVPPVPLLFVTSPMVKVHVLTS